MRSIAPPTTSAVTLPREIAWPHTGRIVSARWLVSTLALRRALDLSALAAHPAALPDELALDISVLEPNHVHEGLVDARLSGAPGRFLRLTLDAPRVAWASHSTVSGATMIDVRVSDAAGLVLDATFDPEACERPRRPVRVVRTGLLARLGIPGGRAEVEAIRLILPSDPPAPRGE